MSRREPVNQVRWEDCVPVNGVTKEHSIVSAGPNGVCRIGVFRLHRNTEFFVDCNLLHKPPQRLTATNLDDAKQEAVDIVRILLHNILSDL